MISSWCKTEDFCSTRGGVSAIQNERGVREGIICQGERKEKRDSEKEILTQSIC